MKCENKKCTREKSIRLVDGEVVCNYCMAHALECEARQLLKYSLSKRRLALDARLRPRGKEAVEKLKSVMSEIFYARRN